MLKLPFKTQPKQQTALVGDESTGTLEIPVYKGLLVGEERKHSEALKSLPDAYVLASRLAVKIDADLKLNDVLFAFDIVGSPSWEDDKKQEIEQSLKDGKITQEESVKQLTELDEKAKIFKQARIKYIPDIIELNTESERNDYVRKVTEVTIILSRINSEWKEDDTQQLPPDLFEKLCDFAQEEINGKRDKLDPPEKPTEDEVGKQPEGSLPESRLTGENSIGDASGSGPTTPDSIPTTLIASPVG